MADEEVESVEAIYADDFSLISKKPLAFAITIHSADDKGVDNTLELRFQVPQNYPESGPKINFHPSSGVDKALLQNLEDKMPSLIQDNLGTSMIFTLVQECQDWLHDTITSKYKPEVVPKAKAQQQAAPTKPVHFGTPVTEQSFAQWLKKFLDESAPNANAKNFDGKLTGKELWAKDASIFEKEDDQSVPTEESSVNSEPSSVSDQLEDSTD